MNNNLNLMDEMQWEVDESHVGQRLDKYVAGCLGEDYSRSQIQQWIKEQLVRVNQASVKAGYKLCLNDNVWVGIPEPTDGEVRPEPIQLDIVYEDADLIVINKPRGMVVHPAPGHESGTLVNALLYHCKDLSGINGVMRPGIVHRIDKDTSGLIMAAKHDASHASLSAQLQEHSVTRKYTAIVHGQMEHRQGTVDAPIGRDEKDRKMYTVTNKNSKHAVTHFAVKERFDAHTLLELQLETGRTHQIRVHMKYIGHPLVGDPMYGLSREKENRINGQALHAGILGFTHPRDGRRMEFEAPLPADMAQLLELLRNR